FSALLQPASGSVQSTVERPLSVMLPYFCYWPESGRTVAIPRRAALWLRSRLLRSCSSRSRSRNTSTLIRTARARRACHCSCNSRAVATFSPTIRIGRSQNEPKLTQLRAYLLLWRTSNSVSTVLACFSVPSARPLLDDVLLANASVLLDHLACEYDVPVAARLDRSPRFKL